MSKSIEAAFAYSKEIDDHEKVVGLDSRVKVGIGDQFQQARQAAEADVDDFTFAKREICTDIDRTSRTYLISLVNSESFSMHFRINL